MSIEYISTQEFKSIVAPGVAYKLRKLSHKRRLALNMSASPIFAKINDLRRQLAPINAEIERAEAAAKLEPCTCAHSKDMQDDIITKLYAQIHELNGQLDADKQVVPEDVCHNAASRKCMLPGCTCRKSNPNPEIGDYDKKDDVFGQLLRATEEELYPVYIQNAVAEVQGLVIDGNPATVETLLDEAPDGLVTELGYEIQKLIRLSTEDALGFKSPTISGAVVDGQKTDTPTTAPSTAPSVKENSPTSAEYAAAPV